MRFEIGEVLKQDEVMSLVFGNCSVPKNLLGRHYVSNGQVITAFHPNATAMYLIDDKGQEYEMDRVERQPIFALFLSSRRPFSYKIKMCFPGDAVYITEDPYSFDSLITKTDERDFLEGNWNECYKKLGAHYCTIDGVEGTYFAVWAPSARRVSVTGDFNYWNEKQYPMNRMERSGIFELFIPGVKVGNKYKYVVKTVEGNIFFKMDPYGFACENGYGDASVVADLDTFAWKDEAWLRNRKLKNYKQDPVAICDISLGFGDLEKMREGFLSEGYTHILLSGNAGLAGNIEEQYKQYAFYSPFYCEGYPEKMRNLINEAHGKGIGVLMEISYEFYKAGSQGLEKFDGTSLYGYTDDRIGHHDKYNLHRFCYDKPVVSNYLISNLLFWIREYHVDGFVFSNVFTDITQTKEHSDIQEVNETVLSSSIAFVKSAIETVKSYDDTIIFIADDEQELHREKYDNLRKRLKFDFYWNYSIKTNMDHYLETDYADREREHYRLSLPVRDSHVEDSILLLNHRGGIRDRIVGPKDTEDEIYRKLSLAKTTCSFLLGMPGKKLWAYSEDREHPFIRKYRLDMLNLYIENSALYEYDPVQTPLEWINPMDAVSRVVTFARKTFFGEEDLLFVCNFSDKKVKHFQVGVPKYGEYRLVSNSDAKEYGGHSMSEEIVLEAQQKCYDLKPFSIYVDIPAYTTMIYKF